MRTIVDQVDDLARGLFRVALAARKIRPEAQAGKLTPARPLNLDQTDARRFEV